MEADWHCMASAVGTITILYCVDLGTVQVRAMYDCDETFFRSPEIGK